MAERKIYKKNRVCVHLHRQLLTVWLLRPNKSVARDLVTRRTASWRSKLAPDHFLNLNFGILPMASIFVADPQISISCPTSDVAGLGLEALLAAFRSQQMDLSPSVETPLTGGLPLASLHNNQTNTSDPNRDTLFYIQCCWPHTHPATHTAYSSRAASCPSRSIKSNITTVQALFALLHGSGRGAFGSGWSKSILSTFMA